VGPQIQWKELALFEKISQEAIDWRYFFKTPSPMVSRYLFSIVFITLWGCFASPALGQDTLYITELPEVILHSWWPEYIPSPAFQAGKSKVVFAKIPLWKERRIKEQDINLIPSTSKVEVEEDPNKPNQYLISVDQDLEGLTEVTFEVWYALEGNVILIKKQDAWVDVRTIYPVKGGRIMLQTITLTLTES